MDARRREEGRGTISLFVTHSIMQTMSPLGRNQEGGPLTQTEGEGGWSAKAGGFSRQAVLGQVARQCLQTQQIDGHASTRNHFDGAICDIKQIDDALVPFLLVHRLWAGKMSVYQIRFSHIGCNGVSLIT